MLGGVVGRASAVVGSLLEDRYDLFYSPSLGCELSLDRKSGDAVISKIDKVGAAAFCGALGIGDRIVGIDGRDILGLLNEIWLPRWLEGQPGDPLWIQAKQAKEGKIRNFCLVRLDPEQLPEPEPFSGTPASLGIKLIKKEGEEMQVDEIEEGGAAWLAMLNQVPPPIMKGDTVRNIDGELTSTLSVEDTARKLEGSPFSWVQLLIIRKRSPKRIHVLRLHRLQSAEADAAVDYRMVAERQSDVPPLFRAGRRKTEPCQPPPVGGHDLRKAAAHALMTCDHDESGSYLSRQPSFIAAWLSPEQRWVAVALSAALLFRLVHIPPSKEAAVNEEAARLWIVHFVSGLSEQLQVAPEKLDVILQSMLHEPADPSVYASFFEEERGAERRGARGEERASAGEEGGGKREAPEATAEEPGLELGEGRSRSDRGGGGSGAGDGASDEKDETGDAEKETQIEEAAGASRGGAGVEGAMAEAEAEEGGQAAAATSRCAGETEDVAVESAAAAAAGEEDGERGGGGGGAEPREAEGGVVAAGATGEGGQGQGKGGTEWEGQGALVERWVVCWAVLSFAVHPRRYDARTRGLVRGLARELRVPWPWLAAAEGAFVRELAGSRRGGEEGGQGSPEPQEGGRAGRGGNRLMRYAKIGGAALVGGAVLGMSGGGAAPAVVAGLSLVAGPATAAAAGGAGMSVAVGMSFGAAGAGLVGYKVARRTGEVEEFEFDLVDSSPGMPVMIGVAGWLDGKGDSAWKVWDQALCDVASDGGEALALRWESAHLRHLGAAIYRFIRDQAVSQGVTAAGTAVLGAAFSSLTLPLALVQAAGMIDSAWTLVTHRADKAGELLAEALAQRAQGGGRPVTLVGFGLGARLVFKSLLHLARMGAAGQGIVETAACLGLPEGTGEREWATAASVCGHRLINGFCDNDWVLKLAYRSSSFKLAVAGLAPVQLSEASPYRHVLHNIDLTGIVEGHWDYRDKLPALMHILGLSSGVALPPPPSKRRSLRPSKSESELLHAVQREHAPVKRSPKHGKAPMAAGEGRGWASDEGQVGRAGASSDEGVSDEDGRAATAQSDSAAAAIGAFEFDTWDGFESSDEEEQALQ